MTSLCFWMHGIATTDPGLSVSRAELSYVGGRVMDSRTTGLEVLRGVLQEDMPGPWLWVSAKVPYAHVHTHIHNLKVRHAACNAACHALLLWERLCVGRCPARHWVVRLGAKCPQRVMGEACDGSVADYAMGMCEREGCVVQKQHRTWACMGGLVFGVRELHRGGLPRVAANRRQGAWASALPGTSCVTQFMLYARRMLPKAKPGRVDPCRPPSPSLSPPYPPAPRPAVTLLP